MVGKRPVYPHYNIEVWVKQAQIASRCATQGFYVKQRELQ